MPGPRFLAVVAVGVVALAALWLVREHYIATKIAAASADRAPVERDFPSAWPPETGPRVLLIGDSRVSDWRHHLPAGGAVLERGLPGETLVQLARRFASDTGALSPDVVVVQAGINDLVAASLADATTARSVLGAMRLAFVSIIADAAASGTCLVLSTIIPPAKPGLLRRLVWQDSVRTMTGRMNDELRGGLVGSGVLLVDFARLLAPNGRLPKTYRRDTLHLTSAAYDRLNTALAAALANTGTPCGTRAIAPTIVDD